MKSQTEILTYNILKFKDSCKNTGITEYLLEQSPDINPDTKNVCAKLSIPLAARLDEVVNLLDMSKRLFIQTAIINALDEFDQLAADLNMHEFDENYQIDDEPPTDEEYKQIIKAIVAEKRASK